EPAGRTAGHAAHPRGRRAAPRRQSPGPPLQPRARHPPRDADGARRRGHRPRAFKDETLKSGVLLMAHGSPDSVDQMGDYLRHVLTRKPPTPEIIAEFQNRYRQIGGRSPLLEISQAQGRALEKKLGLPVYVGMRHWAPLIGDVVEQARR